MTIPTNNLLSEKIFIGVFLNYNVPCIYILELMYYNFPFIKVNLCADIDSGKDSNDIVPSQYEIDTGILDLCDDSHMMKFTHKGAKKI